MLSPDSWQYQPGISIVVDCPLYEISMQRVSRAIGFPVSGQTGALDILLLLERQEGELGSPIIGELYVQSPAGMGHVVNILPDARVVIRGHGFVEVALIDSLNKSRNLG